MESKPLSAVDQKKLIKHRLEAKGVSPTQAERVTTACQKMVNNAIKFSPSQIDLAKLEFIASTIENLSTLNTLFELEAVRSGTPVSSTLKNYPKDNSLGRNENEKRIKFIRNMLKAHGAIVKKYNCNKFFYNEKALEILKREIRTAIAIKEKELQV